MDLVPCYHWLDETGDSLSSMEILAPASATTYKQAIAGGADAIYFGFGEFNARAGAENFSTLGEVVSYCHFHGVKAFLTLNIAFKNSELTEVEEIIMDAENAKIDAFIVADPTIVPIIKKYSKAQIHASTQMGIHNGWGLRLAKKWGFDRAVISREVNLTDLSAMGLYTPVDLEFFIHGALCIGFSGACLLSSMLTGNSGNRGRCNQLCRRYYRAKLNGKEVTAGYLLSAKDICMGERINAVSHCCVRSGKIEGRLRRAEYVQGTTSYYSAIKKYIDNPDGIDEREVKVLFNRGDYTAGYFDGNDVIYPYSPAHIGITVGKVEHLLNAHTALVRSNPPLKREDGYKLMRRDVEVSGCSATGEMKNGYSVIHCTEEIKIGDCVHLTSDSELRNRLLSKKPVVDIILSLKINGGEKPSCFFQSGYYCMDYTFDFTVEKAEKLPLTAEEIKKQFSKNGDNEFNIRFGNIVTHDAFLAKSQLNAMRRKICELAFDYILGQYEREKASEICLKIEPQIKIEGDYAEVRDASFLPILQNFVKNVVYSPDDFTEEGCKNFAEEGKKQGFTVFIRPPVYVSQKLLPFFEKICVFFDGILCNNFGLIGLAKERNLLAVAGPNLNIMNTKNPYIDVCNDYFLSPELNRSEIRKFENGILYTYGKLPLLYLSACLRHLMGITCNTCRGKIELCDEKGSYPLRTIKVQGKNCTHILKNGIVTDIGNEYRYKKFYFDFTESTLAKAKEILRSYYAGEEYCPQDSNKLHLKRGVK